MSTLGPKSVDNEEQQGDISEVSGIATESSVLLDILTNGTLDPDIS